MATMLGRCVVVVVVDFASFVTIVLVVGYNKHNIYHFPGGSGLTFGAQT